MCFLMVGLSTDKFRMNGRIRKSSFAIVLVILDSGKNHE